MKFILLTILATIIIFFVWNILKRIFFNKFYQNFPHQQNENQTKTKKSSKNNIDQKINWDAETVEYEEIKEEKNGEK